MHLSAYDCEYTRWHPEGSGEECYNNNMQNLSFMLVLFWRWFCCTCRYTIPRIWRWFYATCRLYTQFQDSEDGSWRHIISIFSRWSMQIHNFNILKMVLLYMQIHNSRNLKMFLLCMQTIHNFNFWRWFMQIHNLNILKMVLLYMQIHNSKNLKMVLHYMQTIHSFKILKMVHADT